MKSCDTVAVILAGGRGSRMKKTGVPKQFLKLGDKTIVEWTLGRFAACPGVKRIVLVCPKMYLSKVLKIVSRSGYRIPVEIIEGGPTRQESSYLALEYLSKHQPPGIVVIHDAARPFVGQSVIRASIKAAQIYGAAETAVSAIDTIVESDKHYVKKVLDRSSLFYVQTPQSFQFELIWSAHQEAKKLGIVDATDDVQLVFQLGHKVRLIEGSSANFKITTFFDYRMANYVGLNK
ncbi:MAG: 2-C-methyl-D-erythritol 4-phosphate cytidylyltransferase [Candidatus Aureabacteria bacterium]|nr:2-C-methyl-D-erythritol 4-phosphate cytidylyltransferase [Candidatus Auribacterota bacterium]